jgi:hypothetical protein
MCSDQIVTSIALSDRDGNTRARESVRQGRREKVWAWLTLFALILCWDASLRLDERVSLPRVRIAHAGEAADVEGPSIKRH